MKTPLGCFLVFVLVFSGGVPARAQESSRSIYEILKDRMTRFHRLGYDFSGQKISKGTLSIRLCAVDAASGGAVEDFTVTFLQGEVEEYLFNNEVVLLCKGGKECEVGALFPRTYTLRIAAPGYELAQRAVDVRAGGDGVVTVPLTLANGTVAGRVYDQATRQPLAGVVVSILEKGNGVKSCRTNQEGYFFLKGLRLNSSGDGYSLICDSPNHFSKEVHFFFKGGSSWQQDVYLDFAPSVDGKLVDREDNPLADEEVFLLSKPLYESWPDSFLGDRPDASFRQSTNKAGYFRFEKLTPGNYVLVYGRDEKDVAELELEVMDQLKVQLKRLSGGTL
ncbi:MAG TPA: hypothetical protein PLT76_07770 [Candidatus Omnitrophota bacterium]|nr:hypothetical protein [Candidatus Omnitrophota bacterium]HQO58603.1 hypothetical protein [Candidatus Omnitrophota bacterium]